MPGGGGQPGFGPGMGGLARYTAAGGFPGAARRPQLPGGGQNRFMGRVPGGGIPNGLLRTAQGVSGQAGSRLNRLMGGMPRGGAMRFAGGGKVTKKVKELKDQIESLYKRRATTVGHNRRGRMNEQIDRLEAELQKLTGEEPKNTANKAGGGSVRKKSNA